jgi:hypothetical protein
MLRPFTPVNVAVPMPHVLKPKPGKTLEQTYKGIGYTNDQGNAECVEFIKQTLAAPSTSAWREGKKVVKGDVTISAGTAIATFVNGKYPQHGSTGKHAAIYLGQTIAGILVLDQFQKQGAVQPRVIYWVPRSPGASNDGNAFSVIEW